MKIPRGVLEVVAGPLIATAAWSCSTSPPEQTLEPLPVTPTEVAVVAAEPVSYDATRETERLARTDARLAAHEASRQQRIDDEEEEARRRRRSGVAIGPLVPDQRWLAACGRG